MAVRRVAQRSLMMVPPRFYDVGHPLQNAHMKQEREVLHGAAQQQWVGLYNVLTQAIGVNVVLAPNRVGLLDQVFTANAALVLGQKALVSKFAAPARTPETPAFVRFLSEHVGAIVKVPRHYFEGQGDAMFSVHPDPVTGKPDLKLWLGHGFRTDPRVHEEVISFFDGFESNMVWKEEEGEFHNRNAEPGVNAFPLQLLLPEHYHLDTAMAPLDTGEVLVYEKAFTKPGFARICEQFGEDKVITVSDEDAKEFACNAISIDKHIVMHRATEGLRRELERRGYTLHENNMSEFLLSGGSTKCCVLHLDLAGYEGNWYGSEPWYGRAEGGFRVA